MAGTITHSWNGTILTITSDSGTSACNLKGEKGDDGARGAMGLPGDTNLIVAVDKAEAAAEAAEAAKDAAQSAVESILNNAPAAAIVAENTAAIVNVNDAAAIIAVGATTHITATQAGEGVASPTNIRAISGWNAATITNDTTGQTFTAELPEIVYGGTLDWNTGVLTITHSAQTFDGTEEWTMTDDNWYSYYNATLYGKTSSNNQYAYHICSHFKPDRYRTYASATDNSCHERNNNKFMIKCSTITTLNDWLAYLAEQAAAGTPLMVVWELLPKYQTTHQLTAQQIEMLKGSNTVWSDCGETTLTYIADTKLYIDNKFNELQNAIVSLGSNV